MEPTDDQRTRLSVVAFGPLDSGKSTTLGHLMYLVGAVSQREMDKIEHNFAWIFDKRQDARERGITIDVSIGSQTLYTSQRAFTVVDTPGHLSFFKNTVTGMALADCGLLVIPPGSLVQSEELAVVRDQLITASTFGIKQVIVAVNKMNSVGYSNESFDQVKTEVAELMKTTGYSPEMVTFIPISAWNDDNLIQKSPRMAWYDGPTLLDALDNLTPPHRPTEKPLRVTLQDAYKVSGVGTVAVGRVETGILKRGMNVAFSPTGASSNVLSIEMNNQAVAEAGPGDHIGFCLPGVSTKELKRGFVASDVHKDPVQKAIEFTAQLVFLHLDGKLGVGANLVVHCHTTRVACRVKTIIAHVDRQTGAVVDGDTEYMTKGDSWVVVLEPTQPMTVEAFREYPSLGRLVLREQNRVIGVGVVKSVQKAP
ncbi:hypothetical protein Poli38472_009502 [Pythium oligandrum]|uniref:Tr-type G domain-containing protein n=1 Tax=Pythium oligandrum TaxID=41045 RepID=A0A8K1FIF0_PYTOL|nr:hypothetical protein Poli38472_009502 [Pythium oligandrum]|eukprot:TMW62009.1 hypothetical protein Poli38472_009502 [Pythium oligandrum]